MHRFIRACVAGAVAIAALAIGTSPAQAATPRAPRQLAAVSGDRTATLTWQAPERRDGARVIDYVIQRSADGERWTRVDDGVSTRRTFTATGLRNGRLLHFGVAAVSRDGRGPFSRAVTVTPATFSLQRLNWAFTKIPTDVGTEYSPMWVSPDGRYALTVGYRNGDSGFDGVLIRLDRVTESVAVSPPFVEDADNLGLVYEIGGGQALINARGKAALRYGAASQWSTWTPGGAFIPAGACNPGLGAALTGVFIDSDSLCRISDGQVFDNVEWASASGAYAVQYNQTDWDFLTMATGATTRLPVSFFAQAEGCETTIGVLDDGRIVRVVSCQSPATFTVAIRRTTGTIVSTTITGVTPPGRVRIAANGEGIAWGGISTPAGAYDLRSGRLIALTGYSACGSILGGLVLWESGTVCAV